MTFNEQDIVRDAGGRFDEKQHSAPEVALTRSQSVVIAEQARAEAAGIYAAAHDTMMRANRAVAVVELRDAFPGATLAIFSRTWDEDRPRLIQVLGETDYHLDEDGERLTREQMAACSAADRAIQQMGDDDTILEYLGSGEEDHEDWYEFQLPLGEEPAPVYSVPSFLDSADARTRSALDAGLSDRDGRLYSLVDTDEIALRLDDEAYIDDPELRDALEAKYGTLEAASKAIAETAEYEQFRDRAAELVTDQLNEGIERAARAVLED